MTATVYYYDELQSNRNRNWPWPAPFSRSFYVDGLDICLFRPFCLVVRWVSRVDDDRVWVSGLFIFNRSSNGEWGVDPRCYYWWRASNGGGAAENWRWVRQGVHTRCSMEGKLKRSGNLFFEWRRVNVVRVPNTLLPVLVAFTLCSQLRAEIAGNLFSPVSTVSFSHTQNKYTLEFRRITKGTFKEDCNPAWSGPLILTEVNRDLCANKLRRMFSRSSSPSDSPPDGDCDLEPSRSLVSFSLGFDPNDSKRKSKLPVNFGSNSDTATLVHIYIPFSTLWGDVGSQSLKCALELNTKKTDNFSSYNKK